MILKFSIILLFVISIGMIYEVYGHGIGSETLLPKDLDGKQAYIQVNAVTVTESDVDQQFTFQMLEMETGDAIKDVTYEIKASKQDIVLFHETFESNSGTLVFDLVNEDNVAIKIEKQSGGLLGFISGGEEIIRVTGPYFDYGGLYQFEIIIHTAGNYSNKLMPPLVWNAGISIADTTQYTIDDINFGKQDLYHISYYDLIENFQYDEKSNNITFEMPFDGGFESINQTAVVHEEVSFSKEFGDLMVSEISATVNGVLMPKEVIQIDDFNEMNRIIHLTMIKNNLMDLYNEDKIQENKLEFIIAPAELNLPLSTVTKNGQFKIIMESIPKDVKSGQELEISYKLVDVFLKDRPVKVDYDLYVVQAEKMIFQTDGISNDEAGLFDSVKFTIPEEVTGVIYVHFENLAGNSLASAKLPIVIDRITLDEVHVPEWIRNVASLWSEGTISDREFVNGMEYLIKQKIIVVSSSSDSIKNNDNIPEWIRNVASLWSEGTISDREFVNGMEYLISKGIIQV